MEQWSVLSDAFNYVQYNMNPKFIENVWEVRRKG